MWKADTYNSLPGCGDEALEQKAVIIMEAFQEYGNESMCFVTPVPCPVKCPTQVNNDDCGMCIAGYALAIALELTVLDAPVEFPTQLRGKWHACIANAVQNGHCALLNKSYLCL